MSATSFGTLADGSTVEKVDIAGGGLRASVITYGAILQDIRLDGVAHPLVLGFPTLEGYLRNPNYFGATVGRCANRIGKARYTLDGETVRLVPNEGDNQLHGGTPSFGARNWTLLRADASSATLGIVGEDGENGYPGRVEIELTYSLEADGTLRMLATATTDKPTLVNLAQHSYFNLDGTGTILDHRIAIPAETYLPVDATKIPTGEKRPVAGTPFDLRQSRKIGDGSSTPFDRFDHNFCVGDARADAPRRLASVASDKSGVTLDVLSTEPGVQFYGGQMIKANEPGLNGEIYPVNGGLCLEAQLFPDAANHANFPSAVLRPGETYRQETLFRFGRV